MVDVKDKYLTDLLDAASACMKLLEVHPYECFCGVVGATETCPWHAVVDEAAKALAKVGFAPSWYKEKEDGIIDVVASKTEPAEPEKAHSPGDVGTLPNCS